MQAIRIGGVALAPPGSEQEALRVFNDGSGQHSRRDLKASADTRPGFYGIYDVTKAIGANNA